MSQSKNESQRKARLTLLLLAVVFLGPMAVAVVMYYTDFRWRRAHTTQHGVLYGPPDTAFLRKEHPGIGVIADLQVARDLAGQVGQADQSGAGDIYLTDPLGNLVMRYPAGTTMKGIHGDLKHLLTVSTIG